MPVLLRRGYRVRCLARAPRKLEERTWRSDPNVEVVAGDASNPDDVYRSLQGCRYAYYLIHSMMLAGEAYRAEDRHLAEIFGQQAARASVERLVYLGGLGELGANLSEHLTSRREVEDALAASGVPVTVLRAAMIIGSGSASFEILRYLVERLPILVTPKWVRTESQPIAIRNVLFYLAECLEVPEAAGRTLDIGGPEVRSYEDIMQIMVASLGLRKRIILPVPVLTPRLSSLWIHLVTPLSHKIARPLAEGLRNRVVCRNDDAVRLMPQRLLTIAEAIDRALIKTRSGEIDTSWSQAGPIPGDPDWAGGTCFTDRRTMPIHADPASVWRAVVRLGGGQGYYAADWLWRLRGWMDRMIGGPGLRRGRRNPEEVGYGEALDFWRVTGIEPEARLDLRAEMKLPGDALLSFEIHPGSEATELVQIARFRPRGLLGLAYWYAVLPLHGIVFSGMLNGIRKAAETPAT